MRLSRIIVFTRTPWNEPPRARHQLALAISKKHNVVFVEANTFGVPKVEVVHLNNSLSIFKTRWLYNYKIRYRVPVLNELYQWWLIKQLKRVFSNDELKLINFDHSAYIIQKYLTKKPIYYINDNHVRSHGLPFIKKYFKFTESKVIINSSYNICTTKWLLNKVNKFSNNALYSPLGTVLPTVQPKYIEKEKIIRIVLLGFVSKNRTPIDVLVDILEDENLLLTIIGPVEKNVSEKLKKFNNYIEKGVLVGEEMEKEIQDAHIGLALYNLNDVNEGGSPNKLWHYLAFGKPVIISPLASVYELEMKEGIIYIANNKDVLSSIYLAIEENTYSLFKKRIELAKKNSWENKASFLLENLIN